MKRRHFRESQRSTVKATINAYSLDKVFKPGATFKLLEDLYYGDVYDIYVDEMDDDEDYIISNHSWCYDEDEEAVIFPKGTIMVYNGLDNAGGGWPEVTFINSKNKNKKLTLEFAGENDIKVSIIKA